VELCRNYYLTETEITGCRVTIQGVHDGWNTHTVVQRLQGESNSVQIWVSTNIRTLGWP